MPHDVFISYSSVDKTAADTVCSILENDGVRCWMAPRDITPGVPFAEAIIDAIKESKVFILVYSQNSNHSSQVIKEVDRAVHHGLAVITLRLEDVPMSKQLEYYISDVHWLDALTPPLEEHINRLSKVVKMLMTKDKVKDDDIEKAISKGTLRLGRTGKPGSGTGRYRSPWKSAVAAAAVITAILVAVLLVIPRLSKQMDKSVAVLPFTNLSDLSKIFAMQSEVAQSVAKELKAVIAPEEKQLIDKIPTENPEAYEAIQKGQYFLNKFTADALDSALQYFELAKKIDPENIMAYTGIGSVWTFRQQWGLVTPAEGNQKGMDALMQAYALDSNNAVVQSNLASKKVWGTFDWEGGESGFKKSILLNPNNAGTRAAYSHLLNILGRPDEALEQIDIALKLDPVNPFITTFYAVDLFMARKYEESIKAHNEALSLEPGYPFALTNLWQPYYMVGRTEEAYETLKSFWSMDPESLKSLEQGYLKDGFRGAVLSLADRIGEIWTNNPQQFFCPVDIAIYYSAVQETDKAIYWLEQAYKIRDPNLPYLLLPVYDNVRNDPRFIEIARKMNLPYK